MDPNPFHADQDPVFFTNWDPDSDLYPDADPDADPDTDPNRIWMRIRIPGLNLYSGKKKIISLYSCLVKPFTNTENSTLSKAVLLNIVLNFSLSGRCHYKVFYCYHVFMYTKIVCTLINNINRLKCSVQLVFIVHCFHLWRLLVRYLGCLPQFKRTHFNSLY